MAEVSAEPRVKKRKEEERKAFQVFHDEMDSSLIECLTSYKVSCEFNQQ